MEQASWGWLREKRPRNGRNAFPPHRGTQSTLDKPPSNGGAGILAEGTSLRLTRHICFSFGPLVCNASPSPCTCR